MITNKQLNESFSGLQSYVKLDTLQASEVITATLNAGTINTNKISSGSSVPQTYFTLKAQGGGASTLHYSIIANTFVMFDLFLSLIAQQTGDNGVCHTITNLPPLRNGLDPPIWEVGIGPSPTLPAGCIKLQASLQPNTSNVILVASGSNVQSQILTGNAFPVGTPPSLYTFGVYLM